MPRPYRLNLRPLTFWIRVGLRLPLIGSLVLLSSFAVPTAVCQDVGLPQVATHNCAEIPRLLPPVGLEIPPAMLERWMARLGPLQRDFAIVASKPNASDAGVLLKACDFAIRHREFYKESDFAKLDRVLDLAQERIEALASQSGLSWTTASGLQLRGFTSQVDGSFQPLGLELPEDWQTPDEPLPLYVWLHGRGDKNTDLHFIIERLAKRGVAQPQRAIVVHPFGRQCVGYKSAGETDVMEAIEFACRQYPVDRDRIVLMGFSMGGAGVWHLAAHYTDTFVAASSGAGFAETARYQRLTPEQFPPKYEQVLWGMYDVPGYTRNLFNLPFVAYSGQLDKQIQAARVMEEAFQAEGRELTHLIGPGMGHKYHPDTLADILQRMRSAAAIGRQKSPSQLFLQTKHLRYASREWIQVDGLAEPWADTRVDAQRDAAEGSWKLTTQNVSRLKLNSDQGGPSKGDTVLLDESSIKLQDATTLLSFDGQQWQPVKAFPELRKQPKLSGPIDDAFIDPFLVVLPSGTAASPAVEGWVRCELANFRSRWAALFRGDPRVKLDRDVTADDVKNYHLVVWGTPDSNRLLARILASDTMADSPIRWNDGSIQVGQKSGDANACVLLGIYPNPLATDKYVVFNSGPTFRQAHDRTNSLQNPHLPDWAIVSVSQPPTGTLPGKILSTGFFDSNWQFASETSW